MEPNHNILIVRAYIYYHTRQGGNDSFRDVAFESNLVNSYRGLQTARVGGRRRVVANIANSGGTCTGSQQKTHPESDP